MKKRNLAIALGMLAPMFASQATGSLSRSCPLRTKAYGGIPGGGGFGCEREYNVAARRYFEAAHCLLGSLGRVGKDENWTDMRQRERGHIREEIGIMMDVVQEYQKQVYLDQFNPNRYRDVQQAIECNRLAIKDIQTSAPALIKTAKEEKQNLLQNRSTIPDDVFGIANLTYRCIIVTAEALLKSVENDQLVHNAWNDTDIRFYTNGLNAAIEAMYKTGSAARSFLQSPKFLQRFQQLNGVSYQDKVSEIVNVYLGFLVQNNFQIPERPNFSTVFKGFTLLNLEGKSVSFDLTIDTNGWVCGSNVNRMIQAFANPTSGLLRVRLCETTSVFEWYQQNQVSSKTTSVFEEYQQNQVFKDAFEQQFWSVIAHELYHIIDPKLFNKKTIKDLEKHKAQTGDFRGRNFRSQLPTYAMMFVEDFWTAFDKVETEFGKVVAENKLREFYYDPNKYYDWWKYYMPSATVMYDGLKPGEKGFYYSLQALRTSIEDKGYV